MPNVWEGSSWESLTDGMAGFKQDYQNNPGNSFECTPLLSHTKNSAVF